MPWMGAAAYWIYAALMVASIAYQYTEAQKAQRLAEKQRRDAEEAADKRKGYEIPVSGSVTDLPLVYGRAKVGGARVYHVVQDNCIHEAVENKDISFRFGAYDWLDHSHIADKHRYLMFQQALCIGPINKVKDLILEGDTYLDNASLNADKNTAAKGEDVADNWGCGRFDVHYNGGKACNWMSANQARRSTALFTGAAYLTAGVRMRRNNPYFSSAPQVQALIEGRLVRDLIANADGTYTLSNNRIYSTNLALCLLDYLLDFKKVSLEHIDLATFHRVKTDCQMTLTNDNSPGTDLFNMNGKIWRPTNYVWNGKYCVIERQADGSYRGRPGDPNEKMMHTRPIYECNVMLDLKASHRDNINTILSCAVNASLVWSQGQYHLKMPTPLRDNANLDVAGVITDDDLVLGQDVTLSFPSTDTRFNSCTINFPNEAYDFKDDTVTWPIKQSSDRWVANEGRYYPQAGNWDLSPGGKFMQTCAIRGEPGENDAVFTWKVFPMETGEYTLKYLLCEEGTISVNGTVYTQVPPDRSQIIERDPEDAQNILNSFKIGVSVWIRLRSQLPEVRLQLTKDVPVTIEIRIHRETYHEGDIGNLAAGAVLTNPKGVVEWNTRSLASVDFSKEQKSDAIYQQYLREDAGLELSNNISVSSITDRDHALAKAESIVRASRSAFVLEFTYMPTRKIYEPGDVVEFFSKDLNIGSDTAAPAYKTYLLIQKVEVTGSQGSMKVSATRLDWTQNGNNLGDTIFVPNPPLAADKLMPPLWLKYVPDTTHGGSSGKLEWPACGDSRVKQYRLFWGQPGEKDADGNLVMYALGSTTGTSFILPSLPDRTLYFGIEAVDGAGKVSEMMFSNDMNLSKQKPSAPTNVRLTHYGTNGQSIKISWTLPTATVGGAAYTTHYTTAIYRGVTDNISDATRVGEAQGAAFIDTPSEFGLLRYWVVCYTVAGVRGEVAGPYRITLDYWTTVKPPGADTDKPPVPLNASVTGYTNYIEVNWDVQDYTIGGGPDSVIVYTAPWPPDMTTPPAFSEADASQSVKYPISYARVNGAFGQRLMIWLRSVARNQAMSEATTAGQAASIGLIGGQDLTDYIIEAKKLANGAVTGEKLVVDSVVSKIAAVDYAWIDSARINSLDAGKITTGYLSGDRIDAGTITGDKLHVTSLEAIGDGTLGSVHTGRISSTDSSSYIDLRDTTADPVLLNVNGVDRIWKDGHINFITSQQAEEWIGDVNLSQVIRSYRADGDNAGTSNLLHDYALNTAVPIDLSFTYQQLADKYGLRDPYSIALKMIVTGYQFNTVGSEEYAKGFDITVAASQAIVFPKTFEPADWYNQKVRALLHFQYMKNGEIISYVLGVGNGGTDQHVINFKLARVRLTVFKVA